MLVTSQFARDKLTAMVALVMGMLMISRFACVVSAALSVALSFSLALCLLTSIDSYAQDVPGIEICTVEKTMERRTSCLQSNVDFLQKTIARLAADHQQKLDAAYRQTEALKATVIALQKVVDDLQAAHKKTIEDQKKKTDAPAARDGAPAAKDGAK
jgi:endonuclease/exonuclease/phosphatase (EEP) superfamily protein YafD